jgi:LacI family transcriptional regulator
VIDGVVTLQDVADRAGLSLATASRVLNGSKRSVGEATAARIRRVAEELGYVSNGPAQALARSATAVVGLVVHEVDDPYFASIASGAMTVAAEQNLLTTLACTFHDPEREVQYVQRMQAQRVRALLLAGSGTVTREHRDALHSALASFERGGGRVALISEHDLPYPSVLPANSSGAAHVARHLHDLGHRNVGLVTGPPSLITVRDRLSGFSKAWAALGHDVDALPVVDGGFSRAGGYSAMLELARRRPELTAVFALNDLMAVGAMAALNDEFECRVPADVSVVGFDDLWIAKNLRTPLTTVRLPLEAMGASAMQLVLDESGDEGARPANVHMATDLIVRASTAPPAAGRRALSPQR